jgi:DNA-binding CsgD family transcriptional regulator
LAPEISIPAQALSHEKGHFSIENFTPQRHSAAYLMDFKDQRVYNQRGIYELLGYREDEFTYEKMPGLIHPEDRDLVCHIVKTAVLCAQEYGIDFKDQLHLSFRLKNKEGRYIFVQRTSGPYVMDSQNGLVSNYSIIRKNPFPAPKRKIQFAWDSKYLSQEAFQQKLKLSKSDTLTVKEQDVLELLTQSYKPEIIAVQLNIAVQTVYVHRKNIKRKLGYDNWNELVKHYHKNLKWRRYKNE